MCDELTVVSYGNFEDDGDAQLRFLQLWERHMHTYMKEATVLAQMSALHIATLDIAVDLQFCKGFSTTTRRSA
jgi:hypothetical protein